MDAICSSKCEFFITDVAKGCLYKDFYVRKQEKKLRSDDGEMV